MILEAISAWQVVTNSAPLYVREVLSGRPPVIPAVIRSAVWPGATAATGGIRTEVLESAIRRPIDAMRICYDRALEGTPALEGRVVFELVVADSGRVEKVTLTATDLPSGDVVDCAQSAVERELRQVPARWRGVVIVPYLLSPSDDWPPITHPSQGGP